MVVTLIVITTIVVFLAVDFLLRTLLGRLQAKRIRLEREQALDRAATIDVSEESPTLKRVALEDPTARILAVDDEEAILDSFRKVLVLGGYSIDTVQNGAEALGLIRKHDYDFLFTDLKMPGMDGVELTRAARHLRPDIDVVVITGFATIDTAVETVRAGAVDYVQKPFTEDELLAFTRRALIRRQDRQQRQAPPKIHLVRPGTKTSKSRFELNVPAGVFVSPQHAWVQIALNGKVRIGLDDLVRKVFGNVDRVELPENGAEVERGQPLFSVYYGERKLEISAPLSGRVLAVNGEHAEHPEWLAIRPFESSWLCELEPSQLSGELPGLKIGQEAIEWYRQELDRYGRLASESPPGSDPATARAREIRLLTRFSEKFLSPILMLALLCGPALLAVDDATAAAPPPEVIYPSSIGDVVFPHNRHLAMGCQQCHHQIKAGELATPHPGYMDSSWIHCETCHSEQAAAGASYYKCSQCHHSEPNDIADETLSSKVVTHKSCWKCHQSGTGPEASKGCYDCHEKRQAQ